MTYPIVKIVTLFLAVAGYRLALLAPIPPPTKADKLTERSFFERHVRSIGLITHVRSLLSTPR